jgi:thiamine pyrophosphate-dependent acetolactate synthase large subunit-like protein
LSSFVLIVVDCGGVMARRTAADQFVELLLAVGVQRMYGVVGDSLNPVVDAVGVMTARLDAGAA